jgi:hypothetical protein
MPVAGAADADDVYVDVGRVPIDTHWVIPCPIIGTGITTYALADQVVDYAYVDAAGAEQVFIDNILMKMRTSEDQHVALRPYPVQLPAGTLIRARGRFANSGFSSFTVPGITCIGTMEPDIAFGGLASPSQSLIGY